MLAGLAGGVGTSAIQEINYFQPNRVIPKAGKLKRRQFHTVTFETAECLTRVRWVKSDKAVRASIIFQKRRNGRLSADLKEILVVIPSRWKFISKIEELRRETPKEKICELLSNWCFWELLVYSGLDFSPEESIEPSCTTKSYYPKIWTIGALAEESLRLVASALERLTVNQTTQGWARHLKPPDVFKPDTP